MPPAPRIKSMTAELFDAKRVFRQLKVMQKEPDVAAMLRHVAGEGYKATTLDKGVQGFARTYRADRKMKGPAGDNFDEITVEYFVEDMTPPRGGDPAAMIVVKMTAGKHVQVDTRFLQAPKGKFEQARELKVKNGKVVPTNSLWTRLKKCIKKSCAQTCIAALASCTMASWAGYLACLAVACGSCSAKCVACASCNCKVFCKWAVGCCKN